MDKLLRIASVLDESGHYELSDKLFKIAQKRPQRRTPNPPGIISDQELPDVYPVPPMSLKNQSIIQQSLKQVVKSTDPFIEALQKDAPPEIVKEVINFGLEKLESNGGIEGLIKLIATKYGKKLADLVSNIKARNQNKSMPSRMPNIGATKVYKMGINPAFESFLQTTTKLSPNAKLTLRNLMQSTGKNLQNISKSLESFAGSPQAQLIEPAIEIAFNEFGKYLENPEAYKSSMKYDSKAAERNLNPYVAWQELVLKYKAKYKTPDAVLAAFKKDNPFISISVPNFVVGNLFDQPLNAAVQNSKGFNQLDPSVQQNVIYMINNNGALPPSSTTPIMTPGEFNKLKNQQ